MLRLLSAVAAVTFATPAVAQTEGRPTMTEQAVYIQDAGILAYEICQQQPTSETAMIFRFAGMKAVTAFNNYRRQLLREEKDPDLVIDPKLLKLFDTKLKLADTKCDIHILALQLRELDTD